MTKPQDFSKVLQDMVAAFPVDTAAMKDAYKNSTVLSEKMTKVALEAAEKSNDISSKWAKEAIAKFGELSKAKAEPTDYSKALSDFASASAELAAENLRSAIRRLDSLIGRIDVEMVLGEVFSRFCLGK